jgi:uncharacterized protein
MKFSKHNILAPIADSDKYILVNVLTGSADVLSKDMAADIAAEKYTSEEEFIAKGYLSDPAEEAKLYRRRYVDFIDGRDKEEIQIFFVPWYSCNFGCDYCFQESYVNPKFLPGDEVIDAFFSYVAKEFAGRKKYLTIFGGEPLLPGEAYKKVVTKLMDGAKNAGMEIAFVTNGYTLEEYAELLVQYPIREVQVTLDGVETLHDVRRPLKGGGATFRKIVAGIDRALEKNLTVNLRMVIDGQNINDLAELARFSIAKGWTKNPLFKTQLGRNYELHTCQTDRKKLFTRVEMAQQIYSIIQKNPEVMEFHQPAFSITKFLFDNGELPSPLYDSCPGTKSEWAFDYAGKIYSCTATVGKTEEALGTFYPEVSKKTDLIEQWEERDVTTIDECKTCGLQLACGGGCASIAFNASGKIKSPDCSPVKELLGAGMSTYFKKELVEP